MHTRRLPPFLQRPDALPIDPRALDHGQAGKLMLEAQGHDTTAERLARDRSRGPVIGLPRSDGRKA